MNIWKATLSMSRHFICHLRTKTFQKPADKLQSKICFISILNVIPQEVALISHVPDPHWRRLCGRPDIGGYYCYHWVLYCLHPSERLDGSWFCTGWFLSSWNFYQTCWPKQALMCCLKLSILLLQNWGGLSLCLQRPRRINMWRRTNFFGLRMWHWVWPCAISREIRRLVMTRVCLATIR